MTLNMDVTFAMSLAQYYFDVASRSIAMAGFFETICKTTLAFPIASHEAVLASMAYASITSQALHTGYMSQSFNFRTDRIDEHLTKFNEFRDKVIELKLEAQEAGKKAIAACSTIVLTNKDVNIEFQNAIKSITEMFKTDATEDAEIIKKTANMMLDKIKVIADIAITNDVCKTEWVSVINVIDLIQLELRRFPSQAIRDLMKLRQTVTIAVEASKDAKIISYYTDVAPESIRTMLLSAMDKLVETCHITRDAITAYERLM